MRSSLCAAVLCLLLGSIPAPAQEPSEDSWAYVTVMSGPLERVEASFEELGVPLPEFFQREFFEKKLVFIGPGGLRAQGSVGMRMGPGEPGSTRPSYLTLLPVVPEAALLEQFTAHGAKPLPGSSDTIRIKGMFLRRTPDFLILGTETQADITGMDPQALEERLSAPGVLAEVDVNLERWRKTDPATFYPIFTERKKEEDKGSRHVTALGRGMGMRLFGQFMDRVRLTLMDADSSVRLRVELEPLAPGELTPFPKPAFPQAVLGRVDIAYSSTESSQWFQGIFEQFLDAMEKDGLFSEAERARLDVDQMRALFKESFELFATADAISIAVEPVKGKLLYHQVNQYRSPAGFTDRLASVVKRLNALEQKPGRRAAGARFTTSSAAGVRTTRLTLPDSHLTVDFAEWGTTVRIVIAADGKRRLPGLLKLPDEGPLSSGFSGRFDPYAAMDAYLATGKILPFPFRLRTREALHGQHITWNTHAEGTAAAVDFDVPKPLVQAVFQILESRAANANASEP
jgi:hypothetical protein